MRLLLAILIILYCCNAMASDQCILCLKHYQNAEYERAVPVCRRAAEAGDVACQTVLGEMYDAGAGMHQSPKMAARWWNAASAQGYVPAQNLLASKYYYGGDVFGPQNGWEQNYSKAYQLWKKSANAGVPASQFMLGVLYMDGQGVERDYSEAYAWFAIALRGGYKMAADALTELSRKITPDQKLAGRARVDALQQQIQNRDDDR